MKKWTLVILLSALFTASPKMTATAGRGKDLLHEIIEKIERKYNELREHAPFVHARGVPVAQSIRFIQPEDMILKDYSRLKQIALIRHGEPDITKTGKFSREEARQYLKCYDSVCIIVPEKPFFNLEDREDVKVFSSPVNRALTTAHYLCGVDKDITVSPDFREFETRIDDHGSKRRLPIKFWTVTARVKWMLSGKQEGIESFSEARKRARKAAKQLDKASEENPKVLLTAHGMVNRYIKRNLKRLGWTVVEDTGSDYFGTTILVKIEK